MEDPTIKDDATLQFPEGFLWGAATSHFQVEGHPVEMKSRLSDWSTWAATAGNIADSTTADAACDFVSRYLDDIELLSGLNLGALRISARQSTGAGYQPAAAQT